MEGEFESTIHAVSEEIFKINRIKVGCLQFLYAALPRKGKLLIQWGGGIWSVRWPKKESGDHWGHGGKKYFGNLDKSNWSGPSGHWKKRFVFLPSWRGLGHLSKDAGDWAPQKIQERKLCVVSFRAPRGSGEKGRFNTGSTVWDRSKGKGGLVQLLGEGRGEVSPSE